MTLSLRLYLSLSVSFVFLPLFSSFCWAVTKLHFAARSFCENSEDLGIILSVVRLSGTRS